MSTVDKRLDRNGIKGLVADVKGLARSGHGPDVRASASADFGRWTFAGLSPLSLPGSDRPRGAVCAARDHTK